jgi:predicted Rossmann fold nucleotide-binding protein DprA/Smf involved in DNA uptake
MSKFYCLIVGSRTFNNYTAFEQKVDYLLQNYSDVVIVSGGAKGADALAKRYAKERGLQYVEFPANWDKYGKTAGYIRNEEMHKYIAQFEKRGCIAFWDGKSRGTQHNFPLAKKYNTPLKIVKFSVGG